MIYPLVMCTQCRKRTLIPGLAGIPITITDWLSYKDSALKNAKFTISYVDNNQRKAVEVERWYSKECM